MTVEGLVVLASNRGPVRTMDALVDAVTRRGMNVAARIDHAAAAVQAGMALRPTAVLVFGNPRAGTPLMEVAPTLAIDLPLKVLVWQDKHGQTWLAYNDPEFLARRHGLGAGSEAVVGAMRRALQEVAGEAIGQGAGDRP